MSSRLDRLLAQLNQTQLAQKDNPVYQVIKGLIDELKKVENSVGVIEDSGGGGIVNTTIVQQFFSGDDSGGDGDSSPIPGPTGLPGATGATGAAGPATFGPMGMDPEMPEDPIMIPGAIGPQGNTGATGAQGPPFPAFILQDGYDGEDGISVQGPAGANGSSIQDWEGKVVACAGDGNPNVVLNSLQMGYATASPTQQTTSIGRVSYFRLNTAITVANIRWYGIGATTAIYHIAIYRASDNVRMSADNNPNTSANAWNVTADTFTLLADVLYYVVVSVDSTGATAGIASISEQIAATTGQIRALPTDWPGNLDWDNNYVNSYAFAQVVVTLGVLPDPGNAPTAFSSNLTGGQPAIFLDAA